MEIMVDRLGFSRAMVKQQAAINSLRQGHNEMQASFNDLSSIWLGKGGDAFRDLAQELTEETLMGILMITTLSDRTKTGLEVFGSADGNLSRNLLK
jgi:uncharacterized protein YukE